MTDVLDFSGRYYRPPGYPRLEAIVRYPDGETRGGGLPNGTVWVFQPGTRYIPEILGNDVGCGMAAFVTDKLNAREAADTLYNELNGKGILGRGNHFVDVCDPPAGEGSMILLHTDGKVLDSTVPRNAAMAQQRQRNAAEFREELGYRLTSALGVATAKIGDWPHNTVEDNEYLIYRKGAIKVEAERLQMLPAHMSRNILFYTVMANNMPPFDSMPHATSRSGPRGQRKVAPEEAAKLRENVYIPAAISDSSLRTEHPSCFNDYDDVLRVLSRYIVPVGESKVLGYIGKI